MYNTRQQRYKENVLQPQHLNAGEDESIAASPAPQANSRRSSPAPQPNSHRSTPESSANHAATTEIEETAEREETAEQQETAVQEETLQLGQTKRVEYDRRTKIPKRAEWKRIPDDFRKQVRQILNENYKKSLLHIAGSTEDSFDPEAEKYLIDVARKIDKNLKNSAVPGLIDSNLLNPKTQEVTENKKRELEKKLRDVAKLSLIIQQKELALKREHDELEALEKRKEELENELTNQPKEETMTHDYVQSLMKYPSSMIFNS